MKVELRYFGMSQRARKNRRKGAHPSCFSSSASCSISRAHLKDLDVVRLDVGITAGLTVDVEARALPLLSEDEERVRFKEKGVGEEGILLGANRV